MEILARNESGQESQRTYELVVSDEGYMNLSYDAVGNLTQMITEETETLFHWDGANRLVKIEHPGGGMTEFEYDGFGRRVRIHEKNAGGGTIENRTFVWEGLTIVEERNATGATVVKRFFSHGVHDTEDPYFYTKDHLDSIREVIVTNFFEIVFLAKLAS